MKSLVKWKESRMAVVTGFDSEILRAFKVFNVLFVQEVVFGGHLKKFGGDIFDFEFDDLMEDFVTDVGFFERLSDHVEGEFLEWSVGSLSP
jgi:hypothetical protein